MTLQGSDDSKDLQATLLTSIHERFHWTERAKSPVEGEHCSLDDKSIIALDDYILRYIYRNFAPRRHLEFGTWRGEGSLRCLQECDATVWTINLFEGESSPSGVPAYWESPREHTTAHGLMRGLLDRLLRRQRSARIVQTDAGNLIGRLYREKGQGHRVCQIYCDSRQWDISQYPRGFFDSALIDGGHEGGAVLSDSKKALHLVRAGGILLWHDFCPDNRVRTKFKSVGLVTNTILENYDSLLPEFDSLFWIKPSWILLGVKKQE